MLYKVCKDFWV